MTAQFNYFFRTDVVLATYSGGVKSTKTYVFVSKALKEHASVATYWPILRSVGEVSFSAGETLPSVVAGSVEIDNSIGSFGTNRKFSDILQPGYYTPIEQPIVIYVAQVGLDSDTVSSWTQIASLLVSDWEAAANGETLTFNVKPFKFDEKVITLEVNRSVSGMESAPDSSLGRVVPLIIGDNQTVIPVRVSADGATTAKYAWGTAFYEHLENESSTFYVYSKDTDDQWQTLTNAGSQTDYTGITITGSHTLNTYDGRAWRLNVNGTPIITGIQLQAKGNGTGGRVSTAYLDVFIMRVDITTLAVLDEAVAQGSVPLANYDSSNNAGTSNFAIKVSFNQPAVLVSGNYYYFCGWRVRGWAVNELSLNYNAVSTDQLLQDDTSDTPGAGWKFTAAGINRPNHKMLDVTFSTTDHVSAYTQNGLTYSSLTLTQTAPDTGQVNPDFDRVPIAMRVTSGLIPYGGGATLSRPQSLLDLLSYTWNPVTLAWGASSSWDTTTLNSTHYEYLYAGATPTHRSREAYGVFDNKVTFNQVVAEVCRGTATRVGVLTSGKAFTYPWGITAAVAADIPYADVNALTWQARDISTVVNRAVINLGKNYTVPPRDFENADDTNSGYLYSTDFSATNFPQVAAMTLESRSIYNVRDLGQTSFLVRPYQSAGGGYLGNSASEGSVIAEYYLARFAKPLVYCSFVVPWHRYSTLKMFDVVTFSTPAFPAYYGTDPDGSPGVVDTGSSVVTTDPNSSYDMVRAQTYRGLIEGVSYVLAVEHAPALKLTVLVLLNQPYDPT